VRTLLILAAERDYLSSEHSASATRNPEKTGRRAKTDYWLKMRLLLIVNAPKLTDFRPSVQAQGLRISTYAQPVCLRLAAGSDPPYQFLLRYRGWPNKRTRLQALEGGTLISK
jgi:hypothetical protein